MEMRNSYKILIGIPKGKRPPERPISRWDNLTESGCESGSMWPRIGTSGRLL